MVAVASALQADIDATRGSPALAALRAGLTSAVGYEIQRHRTALRESRGEVPVGWKAGCTSAKIQTALGIDGPIYGRLWGCEQYVSGEGEARTRLSTGSFHGLAIEGELAIRLVDSSDPEPENWIVDFFPVIELHHAHFDCDPSVRPGELIAKNGIHAGVVRSSQAPCPAGDGGPPPPSAASSNRCRLSQIPLDIPIIVTIKGAVHTEWEERALLADLVIDGKLGPVATVSWLAKQLLAEAATAASLDEGVMTTLRPGAVVLTATPGSLVPVERSATGVATVQVSFGDQVVVADFAADEDGDSLLKL